MRDRGRELGLSDEDVVATATAFTAESIAYNYREFVFRGRRWTKFCSPAAERRTTPSDAC